MHGRDGIDEKYVIPEEFLAMSRDEIEHELWLIDNTEERKRLKEIAEKYAAYDIPREVPEEIKKMTREELDREIARLEAEAKRERDLTAALKYLDEREISAGKNKKAV